MRVFVTGGSGFVGRAVVDRLLSNDANVTVLRRRVGTDTSELARDAYREVRFSRPDELPSIVQEAAPDVVIHLAADQRRAHVGPADVTALLDANISLGVQLLEGLRGSNAILVNAASYFQFENGAVAPQSLYAATKQAFMQLADYYANACGLSVRHVVLYDNFGPNDTRDKLLPLLLRAASSGESAVIGPLEQRLNLLHVDDVAAGLIAAGVESAETVTTVRASRTVSVEELVRYIEDGASRTLHLQVDPARVASDRVENAGDWPPPPGWVSQRDLRHDITHLARLGV